MSDTSSETILRTVQSELHTAEVHVNELRAERSRINQQIKQWMTEQRRLTRIANAFKDRTRRKAEGNGESE